MIRLGRAALFPGQKKSAYVRVCVSGVVDIAAGECVATQWLEDHRRDVCVRALAMQQSEKQPPGSDPVHIKSEESVTVCAMQ